MSIYNPTIWLNDSAPAINASNLNKIEQGIVDAHVEIASQNIALGSSVAYASTLYSNMGAQGSAIAAHATSIYDHGNAIASLIAEDVVLTNLVAGQIAGIASNTAGVASILPVVATHTAQIAGLGATQGAHSTQLAQALATQGALATSMVQVLATQGAHSTQLAQVLATQAANITVDASQASQLAALATQVSGVAAGNAGLVNNQSQLNRSGNGPVDLWTDVSGAAITATALNSRAIAMKYSPVATLGSPGSGILNFGVWMPNNVGIPTPLGAYSVGIIDGITGSMIAWSGTLSVPSVPSTVDVFHATSPVIPITPHAAPLFLQPDSPYYFILATNDAYRFLPLSHPTTDYVAGQARYDLGLAYEYALPSGVALASYQSFNLPAQGIPTVTTVVPTPIRPTIYPAIFVS